MTDITRILQQVEEGDPSAANELLPLVYEELRRLAASRLRCEKPGQTLQATALVHEAYLKLVAGASQQQFNSRGHFFAAAAEAMRRILVDEARRKRRPKHGGDRQQLRLDTDLLTDEKRCDEVLAVDEALTKLGEESEIKAELVQLRYFAGMTINEAAATLKISPSTADRYWTYAKAFLLCELESEDN